MELAALSEHYGNFYAPAYAVRVGRNDLVRDLLVPVSQVEVDMVLGAASRFAFTVTDCYSQKLQVFRSGRGEDVLDILAFGAEVQVCMGYGDARSTPSAVVGVVTEITTSFPESGPPELSVAGYDRGFLLTIGKNSRTWEDAADSAAAHEIASYNNMTPKIQATQGTTPKLEQNQESDWEFLKKLADRHDFRLYVDEQNALHFAPPDYRSAPVAVLPYGEGLLSFKPEANLAAQVASVEVYGWDVQQKREIVGRAAAGQESGLAGKSAGQYLEGFVRDPRKKPTLRLRQPVHSQAEADQRARAALDERAKKFITGEGEAIGLPEIRPDRRVELTKLGRLFSKPYYIQQATHKIDSNGYRTRFKVEEPGLKEANG